MATRKIVPRADDEGGIGTALKRWASAFINALSANTIALLGGQIAFPATQSPSSDPNTLDDYEEGAWTPVVRGSGTAGTYELLTAWGTYVKSGKRVFADCFIEFAATVTGGGTGYLQITGIPFAKSANSNPVAVVRMAGVDFTAGSFVSASFISSGVSSIFCLYETNDNAAASLVQISGVAANDLIAFSISYDT